VAGRRAAATLASGRAFLGGVGERVASVNPLLEECRSDELADAVTAMGWKRPHGSGSAPANAYWHAILHVRWEAAAGRGTRVPQRFSVRPRPWRDDAAARPDRRAGGWAGAGRAGQPDQC
jgi:hypothetical protein